MTYDEDGHELARRADPFESHLAGDDVAADGTQARMMLLALEALRDHPGLTANELEAATGLLDGKLRKRLNDLRKRGLAYKGVSRLSQVSGKLNATWYAASQTDGEAHLMTLDNETKTWQRETPAEAAERMVEDLNQRELF